MIEFRNFSSVFEVSIGLHLAYSIFAGVRESTLSVYVRTLTFAKDYLPWLISSGVEVGVLVDKALALEDQLIEIERENADRQTFFIAASICISALSAGALVGIAFVPNLELCLVWGVVLAVVALAPMPCFVLSFYLSVRKHLDMLNALRADIEKWSDDPAQRGD